MQAGTAQRQKEALVVFDFDHTIVHENSDTWVHGAAPGGAIPQELSDSCVTGQWLAFMQRTFDYMSEQGVQIPQMQAQLEAIPWTDGMQELLLHLAASSERYDIIILSDANEHFIRWILEAKGLHACFRSVITNRSEVVDQRLLTVRPYHDSHACATCNHNLCKRAALREFLDAHSSLTYGRIVYVGDGANDLCPAKALRPTDAICPRIGYRLHKLLEAQSLRAAAADTAATAAGSAAGDSEEEDEDEEEPAYVGMRAAGAAAERVVAEVLPWRSGHDILAWLRVEESGEALAPEH